MLREAESRVLDRTMTQTRYDSLQKVVGFHYNPHNWLLDDELLRHCNPMGIITVDWVHNMLQDGTFTTEVSTGSLHIVADKQEGTFAACCKLFHPACHVSP